MSLDNRLRRGLREEGESFDSSLPDLSVIEHRARKRKIGRRFLAAGAVAVLAVGAVFAATAIDEAINDEQPRPASTPTVTPVVPTALTGEYSTTLEKGPEVSRFNAAGRWSLVLTVGGTFEVVGPESFRAFFAMPHGSFTVDGNRLVISRTSHCETEGVYEWDVSGSRLKLVPIREKCPHRSVALAKESWVRR